MAINSLLETPILIRVLALIGAIALLVTLFRRIRAGEWCSIWRIAGFALIVGLATAGALIALQGGTLMSWLALTLDASFVAIWVTGIALLLGARADYSIATPLIRGALRKSERPPRPEAPCSYCGFDLRAHAPEAPCPECGTIALPAPRRPILTCGLLAALLAAGPYSWDIANPIGIALFGEWVELERAVVVGHTYHTFLCERTAIAMAIELICAFLFLSIARRALPRLDPTIRIRAVETFAVVFLLIASWVENLTILPAYPAIAVGTIGGIAFYAWAMLRVLSTRSALRTVHRHFSRIAWVVALGGVGIIGTHISGALLKHQCHFFFFRTPCRRQRCTFPRVDTVALLTRTIRSRSFRKTN